MFGQMVSRLSSKIPVIFNSISSYFPRTPLRFPSSHHPIRGGCPLCPALRDGGHDPHLLRGRWGTLVPHRGGWDRRPSFLGLLSRYAVVYDSIVYGVIWFVRKFGFIVIYPKKFIITLYIELIEVISLQTKFFLSIYISNYQILYI